MRPCPKSWVSNETLPLTLMGRKIELHGSHNLDLHFQSLKNPGNIPLRIEAGLPQMPTKDRRSLVRHAKQAPAALHRRLNYPTNLLRLITTRDQKSTVIRIKPFWSTISGKVRRFWKTIVETASPFTGETASRAVSSLSRYL